MLSTNGMQARGVTMTSFVSLLSSIGQLGVVHDKTGLTGTYQIDLDASPTALLRSLSSALASLQGNSENLLPNVAGIVIVVTALAFAQNLLAESVLSYLGLGPPPPAPTWGRMLYEGRAYYRTAPWLTIAPGVAILTAVIAFNLLGEGLRDFFDPKERR